MIKRTIILSILFSFGLFVCAGVPSDKETKIRPRTAAKIADRFYAESYYYDAVEYYQMASMAKENDRYSVYWLAQSYNMSRNYTKAVATFKRFENIRPKNDKAKKKFDKQNAKWFTDFEYNYASALQHNGQYEEAIKHYNNYIKADNANADLITLAKNQIKGCENAMTASTQKIKVKHIDNLLADSYTEAAPKAVNDSVLYFTSLNQGKLVYLNDRKQFDEKSRIFQSVKDANGNWTKATALPSSINDEKYQVGNLVISEDGTHAYFDKCYHPYEDEVICDLFEVEIKNGKWGNAKLMSEAVNSDKYTSTQPCIRLTDNGNEIIYFVSDRPGGVGGMDIWYFIVNKKGDVKGPNPLPKNINTVGDEFTPYFDNESKVLYFSSNGHPGFGGFDVFSTQLQDDNTWSNVTNMGKPINSSYDDIFYARNQKSSDGYMVSNRPGTTVLNSETASDDIFRFENFKYGVEGFIAREGDEKSLDGAIVKLYDKDEAGNDILVAIDSAYNPAKGYFFNLDPDKDYKVVAERSGYKPKTEIISTKNIPYEDTLSGNFQLALGYITTSGNLFKEGDTSKNPLTDATMEVYEVAPNGQESLYKTVIIDKNHPDYNVNFDKDKKYRVKIKKDGYFAKSYEINPKKDFGDVDEAKRNFNISEMEKNKAYTLSNIYYEFNKANLTGSSQAVLDELYGLLTENPNLVIELSSHTDSKGSDSYNQQLSQKRAESCVSYLISKGIDKARLQAKGYGETSPLFPNTNDDGSDNPENRAKNRRTEFKIISEVGNNLDIEYKEKDTIKTEK